MYVQTCFKYIKILYKWHNIVIIKSYRLYGYSYIFLHCKNALTITWRDYCLSRSLNWLYFEKSCRKAVSFKIKNINPKCMGSIQLSDFFLRFGLLCRLGKGQYYTRKAFYTADLFFLLFFKIWKCHIFLNIFQITERKAKAWDSLPIGVLTSYPTSSEKIINLANEQEPGWVFCTTQVILHMLWLSFHLQLAFSKLNWFDKQVVFV